MMIPMSPQIGMMEEMSALSERLQVMMRQEATSYKCFDYLRNQHQIDQSNGGNPQSTSSSAASSRIDESWRSQICEWLYQVVDHFEFNREVVCIAMSYIDRYLATMVAGRQSVSKKIFQLVAMTSLFLAVKLNEHRQLRISSLMHLSRGYFTVEHVASMEESLLRSLEWLVHPPTAMSFVRELSPLIANSLCGRQNEDMSLMSASADQVCLHILEIARFLTELSVCDYYFVTKRPSSIAIAALTIALEVMEARGSKGGPGMAQATQMIMQQAKSNFLQLALDVGMDFTRDDETVSCYIRLREVYFAGGFSPDLSMEDMGDTENFKIEEENGGEINQRIDTISPTSVFDAP